MAPAGRADLLRVAGKASLRVAAGSLLQDKADHHKADLLRAADLDSLPKVRVGRVDLLKAVDSDKAAQDRE